MQWLCSGFTVPHTVVHPRDLKVEHHSIEGRITNGMRPYEVPVLANLNT